MGTETIMLAATFALDKAKFPLMISEKIDGVAADFHTKVLSGQIQWTVRSRDNKPIHSVPHILDCLNQLVPAVKGLHIIAELHIAGKDFKDISGISRRKEPDDETEMLRANIYDLYIEGQEDTDYVDRYDAILKYVTVPMSYPIRRVPSRYVNNPQEFDDEYNKVVKANNSQRPTGCEGVIVRIPRGKDSFYRPAKRPKGFAKLKAIETIDLPIINFEEASDAKTNEPLGMVGRLIAKYKGKEIGIGPGKLTHAERIDMFDNFKKYKGKMAEIAYMPDTSYTALREPRFLYWRPDKD